MDFFGRSAPSEVQLLSAHGRGGAHRWAAHGRRRAEPSGACGVWESFFLLGGFNGDLICN